MRIRLATDRDMAFVGDSWARSLAADLLPARCTPQLARIVRRGALAHVYDTAARCTVWVACDDADEDTIAGWAAERDGVLEYAFVRRSCRSLGVARALVRACGEITGYGWLTRRIDVARLPSGWRDARCDRQT